MTCRRHRQELREVDGESCRLLTTIVSSLFSFMVRINWI